MTREELILLIAKQFSGENAWWWDEEYNGTDHVQVREDQLANAAVILSAIESSGLAIVPVEITQGMMDCYLNSIWNVEEPDLRRVWGAFLSANPLKP